MATTTPSIRAFSVLIALATAAGALDQSAAQEDEKISSATKLVLAEGLTLGGLGSSFTSYSYSTKGLHCYSSGKYTGHCYYGTGGTEAQEEASVSTPKYRLVCPAGRFTSSTGKCADCGANTFAANIARRTACTRCPAGKFHTLVAQTSATACTGNLTTCSVGQHAGPQTTLRALGLNGGGCPTTRGAACA